MSEIELDRHGRPIQYEDVGARPDSVGLFWSEPKKIKPPPKEKVVRIPPEPTWLDEDFLPNLEHARQWNPDFYGPNEMWTVPQGERAVFDIELYPNYFLIMFKSLVTGKMCYFEMTETNALNIASVRAVCQRFCLVGFNSIAYDMPILALALAGCDIPSLYAAQDFLIRENWRPYEVLRHYKVKGLDFDHIDLINVAPLSGSLKEYGGRMHTRHMQDLPFAFDQRLDKHFEDKLAILRYYCANDLTNTEDLYWDLEKSIETRVKLGDEYSLDLRSKSDAQIAEAVIKSEYYRKTGQKAFRPDIVPFTEYSFHSADFIKFESDLMNHVLGRLQSMKFVLGEYGKLRLPEELKDLNFTIGDTSYNMGLGGLHSLDKNLFIHEDDEHFLMDADVTSYYPFAIINSGYYPAHLGAQSVKEIFIGLVEKRLEAKRSGNKRLANELKITINGFFGKLSDRWSVIYSPKSMMQVTLTGQLSLLMLIEKLELAGIAVKSANTDGVVIKCLRSRRDELMTLIAEWEKQTSFQMEYAYYSALLSRDVNNYMAVTTAG